MARNRWGWFKMVQTSSAGFSQASGATIRALSSLTRRDADAVRATVRAAAGCHTVEEHEDYDGYLSLLITPETEARASFMVSGRTGAVDMAELWGDEMAALGTFPSIGAAMLVLRPALERSGVGDGQGLVCQTTAGLRTRHGDDAALHAALQADAQPGRYRWPSILRLLDGKDRGR